MLQFAVSRLLSSYLSDYVQHVDGAALDLALWRGDVVLHNLELVQRNFVGLGSNQFLVKVQKGHIGSLRIRVPWHALSTEPITVELHDLFVLLSEDQHSARRHVAEEIKRTKLAVWDCIARWRSQRSGGGSAAAQPGGLFSPDRIQVKIHNLHIRYEDESADPGHPFVVGVCADQLVVSPLTARTDPEPGPAAADAPVARPEPEPEPEPEPGPGPEPEPEPEPPEWNRSASRLPFRQWIGREVSAYWLPDTAAYRPPSGADRSQRAQAHEAFTQFMRQRPEPHPVLAPVSGILEVTFAEEYMRVCLMQCSHASFELSMRQLRDINALRERISGASERRQIESIRRRYTYIGNKNLRALGGSRLWRQLWFFAAQCLTALRRRYRPRRMTWEQLRARRDQRRAYVALYSEMQIAAYARTRARFADSAAASGGIDAQNVVEQALLGELHPALSRHAQIHGAGMAASTFGFSKFWEKQTDAKRCREIKALEADMTVADIQCYRKIAISKILQEGIEACETNAAGDAGQSHRFPFSWWVQQHRAAPQPDLSNVLRDLVETLHEFEPDVTLRRHLRTHIVAKLPCSAKLSGFNASAEHLVLEFGTVTTEVKFFGSLVDSSEISASELTMSLMREDVCARSHSQESPFAQPVEACIPIFRCVDKMQRGGVRVALNTSSSTVGSGQGLNTWDRGIYQRQWQLQLQSVEISFDCKAYDTLHQLFMDLCALSRGEWREWDEMLPDRWGRSGRRSRGRDISRVFGQRVARFRRSGAAARSATNIATYDEDGDNPAADRRSRSSSLRHIRSADRIDSLDGPSHNVDDEREPPEMTLLRAVWKHAVAQGMTDRDAVRIMLDHLQNQGCTVQYYLYMWLQRLRVTRVQVDGWMQGLPRFDDQLLEELHSLCSPELIADDEEHPPAIPDTESSTRVPLTTQNDTVKREGRKMLRFILNSAKIIVSADINDPQSPTLLIVSDELKCERTPAPFFEPAFLDRGDAPWAYYDTTQISFSRARAFVAPRDYLYHCMRNRKLSELSILSENANMQLSLRQLAVPKPIFVSMPREKYSLQFSALAFVFSYDRLAKFASIIRTFMTTSEILRPKPRDPDDLPGAIIYEYECPSVTIVFAQSKEVSLRVEAEHCAVCVTQPRWLNIEPASSAKSVSVQVSKFVAILGDPTGIQDGSPTAKAELCGLVYEVGATDERKVVVDSLTLSGCRPRSVSILRFPENDVERSGGSSVPVIQFQQGSENGRLFRSLSVAPLEIVYDADVFALLVELVSNSVGIPGFSRTSHSVGHEVALPTAAGEPTPISLEAEQKVKTSIKLCSLCVKVVLSQPSLTVSIRVDNAVAEAEDRQAGVVVERVAMLTSLALTERESEFCRAECAHVGNAVEVSLGSRDGIRTVEINIQHPWCRIGYGEARAVHHAFTAVSHAFTRFGVAPAVDSDDLPLRSPLLGVASPSYLASPMPKHKGTRHLRHTTHCQIKVNALKLELYDTNARCPLVIQFSASCKHDEFEGEAREAKETKGRVVIKGLRVYFDRAPRANLGGSQPEQPLCLLQCSLVRPEYTIKEHESRRLDVVLDREQRSPAIVCQFSTEDAAELAAVYQSLCKATASNRSPLFQFPAAGGAARRKTELGMDLLFEDLRVYYVSGWPEAPVVRMLLKSMNNKPLVCRSGAKSEEPRLEAGMEFCIDILNAQISCWEPMLEPVAVEVEHWNVRLGHSKLNIRAGMVNINVTRMVLDMLRDIRRQTDLLHDGALAAPVEQHHAALTTSSASFPLEPALVCIIRNETHTELFFPRHLFRRVRETVSPARSVASDETGDSAQAHSRLPRRSMQVARGLHVEDDEDDDEGEDSIPGHAETLERELRSGVITSDSKRHRAHRIQFRMDGFVPATVDIERIGVFPVSLHSNPMTSASPRVGDDTDNARGSISLICSVSVIRSGNGKGGKRVVIRSPVVIRNSSARAIDIKFGDHKVPGNFAPSDREFPLEVLHAAGHFGDGQLMVRPGRQGRAGNLYTWSRRLAGKTLSQMRQGRGDSFQLSCVAIDGSSADFVVSVYVVNKDGQTYIEFLSPLVIENALACDCEVYMRDQTGGNVFAAEVPRGGKSKVHEIDIYSAENTMVVTTAGFTGELRQQGSSWPEIVRLRNRDGRILVLATDVSDGHEKQSGGKLKTGALFVVLFTTHWVLNNAEIDVELTQQGVPDNMCTPVPQLRQLHMPALLAHQKLSPGAQLHREPPQDSGEDGGSVHSDAPSRIQMMYMFSFLPRSFVAGESDEKPDRATNIGNTFNLRCSESGATVWSDTIDVSVDKEQRLHLQSRLCARNYQLCSKVEAVPGVFHRTKLVTLSPCVLLTNRTEGVLMIKDAATSAESLSVVVSPTQTSEFHFSSAHKDGPAKAQINVRAADFEWSRPLQIDHADDFYLFLRKQEGGSGNTIRVTVNIDGDAIYVAFHLLDHSYAQLRVENDCKPSTVVRFRQYGLGLPALEVASGVSMLYSWEDPQLAHRLEILVQDTGVDVSWDMDMDVDSAKPRTQERHGDYVLHVVDAGGSTFVLRVVEFAADLPADPGTPMSGKLRSNRGLEAPRTVDCELEVAGIALSFIDNSAESGHQVFRPFQTGVGEAEELIHCSIYGVRLNAVAGVETKVDFSADYLQIDNHWHRKADAHRPLGGDSFRREDGKSYAVVLAPTDKELVPAVDQLLSRAGGQTKPFLRVRIERVESPGVDCYRSISLELADLTVTLDGNLIERVVGPVELTTNKDLMHHKPRTVWLFRGPEATRLGDIFLRQKRQLRQFTDAAATPRRLFIQRMRILPYTVTISHSGRPSVLATDGFENVPVHFTKYEGRHIHAAAASLLSKLRALYGRQLALKLPQFISAASLLGNPAGIVQTFRQELERVVEESVASLKHFNLLELQHTVIGALRSSFSKVTGGLGSACHLAATTLNQYSSWSANSVKVQNLPLDIQSEELSQIFASYGAAVLGNIIFEAAGDSMQASVQLSLPGGMAQALALDGANIRGKALALEPQPHTYPPGNPLTGVYRGLHHCLYYHYRALRGLQLTRCLLAPLQGTVALIFQPVSGLFAFYDKLFLCLGKLYPRESYRTSRPRIRASRRFGRHGSIQPLKSGSSLDRDLLHFVETLEELALEGPATVAHQTRDFALLTTEHALVYVRRQPTLRLEWYIFGPCLLAYDVPAVVGSSTHAEDMGGSATGPKIRSLANASVNLLCLRPLQLAAHEKHRQVGGWRGKRLRSLPVDVEAEAQIGPLLRRLRKWWIGSKPAPVDNRGAHVAACIAPGVIARVPAFEAAPMAPLAAIPSRRSRRAATRAEWRRPPPRRLVRYHDVSLVGASRTMPF